MFMAGASSRNDVVMLVDAAEVEVTEEDAAIKQVAKVATTGAMLVLSMHKNSKNRIITLMVIAVVTITPDSVTEHMEATGTVADVAHD